TSRPSMLRGAPTTPWRRRARRPECTRRRRTGACTMPAGSRSRRRASCRRSLHRLLHPDLVAGIGDEPSGTRCGSVVVVSVLVVAILVAVAVIAMLAVMTVPVLVLLTPAVHAEARLILGGPHEIHRPVAGVVLVTVLAPVLGVTGRHVQVDRLHQHRLGHDDRRGEHRVGGDDRWR